MKIYLAMLPVLVTVYNHLFLKVVLNVYEAWTSNHPMNDAKNPNYVYRND